MTHTITSLLITGARVIDPASGLDETTDLALANGRVAAIGPAARKRRAEQVIEADGLTASPAFVDAHVHFRDPGFTYKEDLASGAAAACAGGFGTVVCMANTAPTLDTAEAVSAFLARAGKLPVRIHTVAAVTKDRAGKTLTDFAAMREAGAVGFSDDGSPLLDAALCRRAFAAAAALDVPVLLHEEDPAYIGTAGVNDGPAARQLGLRGASAASESTLLERDAALALESAAALRADGRAGRVRVHFQHLSAAASVTLTAQAKSAAREAGALLTAEATPSHLALSEADLARLGTLAKVNPPLRAEADRQALLAGLQSGIIDLIATDHAPHAADEKALPFPDAPSGLIGLETALAVCLTYLVRPGLLSLPALLARLTLEPARLYNLAAGQLSEGGPADITLFDPDERWTVDPARFRSKSRNTPFAGQTLYGAVKHTIVRGRLLSLPPEPGAGE